VLRLYGIQPELIVIEVTESAFSDSGSQTTEQLLRLRDLGVKISIDDFGKGYSSLGRLRELPLDVLKMDKSFVAMVKSEHDDIPIFRSVLSTARRLGLQVTAEVVETETQARKLLRMGCDSLQGYLFAKPGPAASLAEANKRAVRIMSGLRRSDHPLTEGFPALLIRSTAGARDGRTVPCRGPVKPHNPSDIFSIHPNQKVSQLVRDGIVDAPSGGNSLARPAGDLRPVAPEYGVAYELVKYLT